MAKTSKAFDIKIHKELMRQHTLSFNILNNDNAFKYINSMAQFLVDGQKYYITGFRKNSGFENVTTVTAEHVSYKLSNYILPVSYAFTGTTAQLGADILDKAVDKNGVKANLNFSIGSAYDKGTFSFQLNNKEPMSAKFAFSAFTPHGLEVDYDDFAIRITDKIQSGNTKSFKFGKDLSDFNRTWDIENGTSYDVQIANLQRIGSINDTFYVGDTVYIIDDFVGETITNRVISYVKCLDDPTQDSITLGEFKHDSSNDSVAMEVEVKNSVKTGKTYNNCSISHDDGFKCETSDGKIRVMQNATNGFIVQHKIGSDWSTVWEVDSTTGISIAYNDTHTTKVEMGGETGFATYYSNNGQTWFQTSAITPSGNFCANRLGTLDNADYHYAVAGHMEDGTVGFKCISSNEAYFHVLEFLNGMQIQAYGRLVLSTTNDETVLAWYSPSGVNKTLIRLSNDGVKFSHNGTYIGINDTIIGADGKKFIVKDGLITGWA